MKRILSSIKRFFTEEIKLKLAIGAFFVGSFYLVLSLTYKINMVSKILEDLSKKNISIIVVDSVSPEMKHDVEFEYFKGKELNKENLLEAIHYYELDEPEWVYAQSVLETGGFTSKLTKTHNNIFGMYNSREKSYYSYDHWLDSLLDYKKRIQNKDRYNKNRHKDYGKYLEHIGYAEDPNYVNKLKKIIIREFSK